MPKYFKNIDNFWKDDLTNHNYKRKVEYVARNFDHLDRNFYNHGYILQSFNEELKNSDKFKNALEVENGSVSWTCILPNSILPSHKDTFYTLRQEFNIDLDQCFRFLIFLEDWKFGHYVGFENINITHWKAGDVWIFDGTEMHFGVNASNENFHSCQVSTFQK